MTPKDFWIWFVRSLPELERLDPEQVPDVILEQLQKLHPSLGIEIGMKGEYRELIITVYGERTLFKLARQIVAEVPQEVRWTVIALKPAKGFAFTFAFEGISLRASQLQFEPLIDEASPQWFGIRLFFPVNTHPEADWLYIATSILSSGLGEESFSKIDFVDFEDDAKTSSASRPISSLSDLVLSRIQEM